MRPSVAFLFLALLGSASAAEVSFTRVWPQWRSADSFDRIREYFGGAENDGRELVLRTHADQRAGLYFLVRVKADAAVEGGKFVLEVVRPDNPQVRTYTFPAAVAARSQVLEFGLTDGDWPGGRTAHPVAWKVSLVDGSGKVLAAEQSFLWENPEH
jgi:hypothetical protein